MITFYYNEIGEAVLRTYDRLVKISTPNLNPNSWVSRKQVEDLLVNKELTIMQLFNRITKDNFYDYTNLRERYMAFILIFIEEMKGHLSERSRKDILIQTYHTYINNVNINDYEYINKQPVLKEAKCVYETEYKKIYKLVLIFLMYQNDIQKFFKLQHRRKTIEEKIGKLILEGTSDFIARFIDIISYFTKTMKYLGKEEYIIIKGFLSNEENLKKVNLTKDDINLGYYNRTFSVKHRFVEFWYDLNE